MGHTLSTVVDCWLVGSNAMETAKLCHATTRLFQHGQRHTEDDSEKVGELEALQRE